MFGLSTGEIILIAVVLILLFGAKKIPELAKSLGESVRHLKKGLNGEVEENLSADKAGKEETPATPEQAAPAQAEPAVQTTETPAEEKKEEATPAEEVSQEETPKQQ